MHGPARLLGFRGARHQQRRVDLPGPAGHARRQQFRRRRAAVRRGRPGPGVRARLPQPRPVRCSTQHLEWPTDQFLALTAEFGTGDSHFAHGHRIPEGGCLGQARQEITGPTPATKVDGVRLTGTTSIAMRLWIQSGREARKDPAWKKADRAWSDCMKKRGFHYADPDAASLDTAWFRTDKPTGAERKTAAADATCKLDTGYIQSVHALQARAQKSAIRRNKQELEDQRAAQQRAVRNARAIVAKES
ncbi:hypothetical protein ACQ4WX_36000 [Streptomyces lasalocidi]